MYDSITHTHTHTQNKKNAPLALVILSQRIDALNVKVEQVQRHGTRWIFNLKPGQMLDGEKLLALNMLPLASNRVMEDLVFFHKAFYGYNDIDVANNTT